jgi:hypothetical protein
MEYNKRPRNDLTQLRLSDFQQRNQNHALDKRQFLKKKWCLENRISTCKTLKHDSSPTLYIINSKLIKNLM